MAGSPSVAGKSCQFQKVELMPSAEVEKREAEQENELLRIAELLFSLDGHRGFKPIRIELEGGAESLSTPDYRITFPPAFLKIFSSLIFRFTRSQLQIDVSLYAKANPILWVNWEGIESFLHNKINLHIQEAAAGLIFTETSEVCVRQRMFDYLFKPYLNLTPQDIAPYLVVFESPCSDSQALSFLEWHKKQQDFVVGADLSKEKSSDQVCPK